VREILVDLRRIKAEYTELVGSDGKVVSEAVLSAAVGKLDEFQLQKLKIVRMLQNVIVDVGQVRVQENESKTEPTAEQKVIMIRRAATNRELIRSVQQEWIKLKIIVQDAERTNKWASEVLADRKQHVVLINQELLKQARHNIVKTPSTIDYRQQSSARKPRKNRRNRRADESDPSDQPIDLSNDLSDEKYGTIEMPGLRVVDERPTTMAAAAAAPDSVRIWMEDVASRRTEEDELLDQLGRGVAELNDLAQTIGQQIGVSSSLAQNLDQKLGQLHERVVDANKRTKLVIAEENNGCSYIPLCICCVVLVALVIYALSMVLNS
jgi:hypothetical protein